METKTVSLSPNELNKPLIFELTNGNIKVVVSTNDLTVDMEYTPMGSIIPEVVLEEKDECNLIVVKNSEIIETNLILTIPRDIPKLGINLDNGDIFIKSYNGNLDLQTTNGGIKLENVSGSIKAVTFNGEINIDSIKGELHTQLTNGPLKILKWECTGGSIEAKNSKVLIGLEKLDNSIDVRVRNGSVTLGIEKSLPCTIIGHGTDVINYLESPNGKSLGSPAKIINKDGTHTITLISSSGKIKVATISQLDKIVPDFEKWFEGLEKELHDNLDFNDFANNLKSFGKNLQNWGLNFAKMLSSRENKTKDSNINEETTTHNTTTNSSSAERMEILNLLKEGKISAEEAEKLIKALK